MDTLQNSVVRQGQNNDGRSVGQVVRDSGTLTAHTIIGDPNIASNPELRRQLSRRIDCGGPLRYRAPGGSHQSMSIGEARSAHSLKQTKAALTGGKDTRNGKMPITKGSDTPSHNNFTRNKRQSKERLDDANRARRNQLSPIPLDHMEEQHVQLKDPFPVPKNQNNKQTPRKRQWDRALKANTKNKARGQAQE